MVPHTGGQVGRVVGIQLRVLDLPVAVVEGEGAVGPLRPEQPLVGPLHRLAVAAADVERHGRLDVVPRIGVAAGEPRYAAVAMLRRRDAVERLAELGRGQHGFSQ